jgi:hypothetical protein
MALKDSAAPAAGALDGAEILVVSQVVSSVLTSVRTTLAAVQTFFRTTLGVWTKNQSVTPTALTFATTVTPDASTSNNFKLTLTGACTIANPTNLTEGMVLNFCVDQDATGGRVLTLGSAFKWPGGTAPTWSTTANAKNFFSAYYDGTVLRCGGAGGYS